MCLWYFLRVAPGDLRPLETFELECFLRGELPLPGDVDCCVHWVGLEVEEHRGTPLSVERVWFTRMRTRPDGLLDPKAALARINERLQAVERLQQPIEAGHPVVDARDLFVAKRLMQERTWQPTDHDVRSLRLEVRRRAGWAML